MMRISLILMIIVVLVIYIYQRETEIRFEGTKARIGSRYCRLAASAGLPQAPVIMVPGIKGSHLVSNGEHRWLGLRHGLPGGEPLWYREGEDVRADGILTRLTFIPTLLELRPYYRMVAQLACNPNARFFSYDWRAEPAQTADKLLALIEQLTRETGQRPAMVAHSLGGLITHYLVKRNPNAVNRLVYVGVPFQPGIGYMDDIHEGSRVGLNSTLLSKEAIFSHPTSFILIPGRGRKLYKGKDLMDVSTWVDEKLSVFAAGKGDKDALRQRLARAHAFRSVIDTPQELSIPTLVVTSRCHATIWSMKRSGEREYLPGDGRVSYWSSFPYDTIAPLEIHESCADHAVQLDDAAIVERIFTFLQAAE